MTAKTIPAPAPATAFGARPELKFLKTAELAVDRAYQRTIDSRRSQALIARIAAGFRWSAFQAILATAKTGGGYLVLDVAALKAAKVRIAVKDARAGAFVLDGVVAIDRRRLLAEANEARRAAGLPFLRFESVDWTAA